MKSVKAINEIKHNWHEGSCSFAIESICDVLIAITERLEAQEKPVSTSAHVTMSLLQSEKRKGMIEALRWGCGKCGGCTSYEENKQCHVTQAITRLENGDEL